MRVLYFEVGGSIRDRLLGLPNSDVDYSVEAPSFQAIIDDINSRGGKIYLVTEAYFTIRARLNNQDCDFVWCRREDSYSDSRHPDWVEPGTIYDDLARRDFTCNAIAIDKSGNYIDPHNGIKHIELSILKCVGRTDERMNEDALRMVRALRFWVTKKLTPEPVLHSFLRNYNNSVLLDKISDDRIRQELDKMFRYNTDHSIQVFNLFPAIRRNIFNRLWLKPTSEQR